MSLAELNVKLTAYQGEIIWDSSKPDGQPRRMLDTDKAEREFGFQSNMDFEKGLENTIEWFQQNKRFKRVPRSS